ncbi:MAG TPA: SMC-Scp complex subunit ScpB [Thermoanaerobaculia bacterium]|jgi:segregation and condensation protein B
MEPTELRAALEAILFVSTDPVQLDELAEAFPEEGKDAIAAQLEEMKRVLDANLGGFTLEQTAGGWRFATRAEHDPVLKKYFAKKGENRLSLAALETLAIVAYRQPITAPEVSDIRGVNSTGVIRTLLERRMIRVAGRKNVVGSPFLYRTTKEFLVHFGLNDIRDLPRLEEFGDLIGENIGDDLVAAIAAADETTDEATSGVEIADVGEASRGELDQAAIADLEKNEDANVEANDGADVEPNNEANDDANDDAREEPSVAPDAETEVADDANSSDDEVESPGGGQRQNE